MGSLEQPNPESANLPIVDFANWTSKSTSEQRHDIGKKLVMACHSVGFVYIVNHGVSSDLLEEAFGWSKKLFDLKHEEKMLAPHPDGPQVHRGYSHPGLEKVRPPVLSTDLEVEKKPKEFRDFKESYEVGSEDNKEQPNIWLPESVLPGYREFITKFYWECSKASHEILKAIGTGLGLKDPEWLLKFHSGHNNQLRLAHYPPIPAQELEDQISGRLSSHCDWSSITMLFQDDCGGLEVENRHKPGEYVKATPIKDAIVMNIGDLLMRWSNDYLKSTLHRVTLPPTEDRFTGADRMTRARYSIPYFVSPDIEASIECLPECTTPDNPAKYEPVTQRDYNRMKGKVQYTEKAAE